MSDLMTISVDLPKNKMNNNDLINKRFFKLGFKKLVTIKRESLPVIENASIVKRFKTERSGEKQRYFNEF